MNIEGAQGLSPEDIRNEINRGGRLVIYTYCVSILIMTFKRPTAIRLIRAGRSPAAAGLPYVLISLVCGWWGFPWGPIYTVGTIYRNLCGGLDVTDEVLAQLPVAGKAAAAAPTSFTTAPAAPGGFNLKVASLMVCAAALLAALGVTVYCYQRQQSLTVIVASGIDQSYSVELNGQTVALPPHGIEVLQLAEGDFTLKDAAGGRIVGTDRAFRFALPFLAHLNTEHVAIINPDNAAVFMNSEVPYYKDGTTPPADENPPFTLLANQPAYFIPKPDFVIEQPTPRVSMPSGTTRVVKTRLEKLAKLKPQPVAQSLADKSGYAAAREHLTILARYRSDEELLQAAVQVLKPEDLPAFFHLRLAERPVLVEWHRYYQQTMDYTQAGHDLAQEYRGYLQAEPGNGALMYLLGRHTADHAEAARLWTQALAADPPCHYAHGAMGFDALSEGRFAEALAHYAAADKAGVSSASRRRSRRELYWALDQPANILAELAPERKQNPLDLELAADEIRATFAASRSEAAATKVKSQYLSAYQATRPSPANLADADAYLQAAIAYHGGQSRAFADLVTRFNSPYYKFQAALSRGELKPAAEAIAAQPRPRITDLLLLYLLAQRTGDEAAADRHFQQAVEAMRTGPHELRRVASLLAAPEPPVQAFLDLRITPDEKRILLTALGVRLPAAQPHCFAFARKLNFNPEFPYQFLSPILAQSLK